MRRMISSSFLLSIIFILSILLIGYCSWDEAISYRGSVFPCAAGCDSNELCYSSEWDAVVTETRSLTESCKYVLYSVAIGRREISNVHPISDFWNGKPCSIFILSHHSKFVKEYGLETGSRLGNWTVAIVRDNYFEKVFRSNRRAAKIPKFSPHHFFHANVKVAIFIDAKLQAVVHPMDVIRDHFEAYDNVILTAVQHPGSTSFVHEFRTISDIYHVGGNYEITDNYDLLKHQVSRYNESVLMKTNFTQAMIDAGYMVMAVHDQVAIEFRCSWLDQVQKFSDRDQISFPYVVGWISSPHSLERTSRNSSLLKVNHDKYGPRNINFLDNGMYCWHAEGTRVAKELPRELA